MYAQSQNGLFDSRSGLQWSRVGSESRHPRRPQSNDEQAVVVRNYCAGAQDALGSKSEVLTPPAWIPKLLLATDTNDTGG
jgi:hypothetical protein